MMNAAAGLVSVFLVSVVFLALLSAASAAALEISALSLLPSRFLPNVWSELPPLAELISGMILYPVPIDGSGAE